MAVGQGGPAHHFTHGPRLIEQAPSKMLLESWTSLVAQSVNHLSINAGDLGSSPGRFPGEGNGNPLQDSCLEHPMDRGAWCRRLSMGSRRVGHDWAISLTSLKMLLAAMREGKNSGSGGVHVCITNWQWNTPAWNWFTSLPLNNWPELDTCPHTSMRGIWYSHPQCAQERPVSSVMSTPSSTVSSGVPHGSS